MIVIGYFFQNISDNRVPDHHFSNSSNVSTHQQPTLDTKHVTENSTNTPHPSRSTTAPNIDDDFLSPSQKPPLSGTPSCIRKGTRLLAKEDAKELDMRNVEPLEDPEKRSETTTLLIQDANKSEKCNGLKDLESGIQFNPGVIRGQKSCCGECCIVQ